MTIFNFAKKHASSAINNGVAAAAREAINETKYKAARPLASIHQDMVMHQNPRLIDVLDDVRDQDKWLIIIFDSLRYDIGKKFFSDAKPAISPGYDTFEWGAKAWSGSYDDVTYVSSATPINSLNTIGSKVFEDLYNGYQPSDHIGEIVDVWLNGWDESTGTVPPETTTNYALDHLSTDKLVVHYFQPHAPYIGATQLLGHVNNRHAIPGQGEPADKPIWNYIASNKISDERLYQAYVSNFKRAFDAASPLFDTNKTLLITSDHGEALGEYNMYGHHRIPHPKTRLVPVVYRP